MAVAVLLTAISALLGGASAFFAWSHVRRVGAATSADVGSLANALKRLPPEGRLAALAERARPGSWEHRLATEALEAPSPPAKVAAANDALAELDHVFRAGAGWASAGLRVAFLGSLFLGLLAWLLGYPYLWSIVIVSVGAVAALACLEAGRSASRRVAAARRDVDALIDVALGHLLPSIPAGPRRRGSRS